MATTIQLKSFTAKASPVPADIVYLGDSGNSFDEVQSTIAQVISAYPALSSIAGLTTVANEIIYTTAANTYATAPVTAFSLSVLALVAATTTPTASVFAGWDVNSDLSANNFLAAYATTATAAGTTTLVVGSPYNQYFTGATTQTVILPVTSTLVLGQSFRVVNNSSGVVTVQSSGANTITAMAANTSLIVTVISTSGTTAASWDAQYFNKSALVLPLSVAQGGTGVGSVTIAPTATAWAAWDTNKNLSANNFLSGYTTTATAAGTTTLTVSSTYNQYFTGSTTQTVIMPVTSTLVLGQSWLLVNNSSGVVTIQSSGGNTIVTMAANTQTIITCILTSGTTAASWSSDYSFSTGSISSVAAVANQTTVSITGNVATVGTVQNISNTSSPTFAGLTLTTPYIAGAGGLHSFQIFITGTAQTYTKPANVTSILVECIGGGGGGGGSTGGSSTASVGGAGGGGGYARLFVPSASSTYTYTVGAGGTAGTSGGGTGGTGGTTTFSASSLQATGGIGGTGLGAIAVVSSGQAIPGGGGIGSNGNINVQGNTGTFGGTITGFLFPGKSGESVYGGGVSLVSSTTGAGVNGGNYGAGGSGGVSSTVSFAGGAGSPGLIIVWEFA